MKSTSALFVDKWIRFNRKEGIGQRTDVKPAPKYLVRQKIKAEPIEQASEYYRYLEALQTLFTIIPLRTLKRHPGNLCLSLPCL